MGLQLRSGMEGLAGRRRASRGEGPFVSGLATHDVIPSWNSPSDEYQSIRTRKESLGISKSLWTSRFEKRARNLYALTNLSGPHDSKNVQKAIDQNN